MRARVIHHLDLNASLREVARVRVAFRTGLRRYAWMIALRLAGPQV